MDAPLGHDPSAQPRGVARSVGCAPPIPWAPDPIDPSSLRSRYEAYRRQQIRDFLSLVPREALRPLYRQAWSALEPSSTGVDDPVALLSDFVERHLPLPPFHVWLEDVRRNPDVHLEEGWMEDAVPDPGSPFTLDTRVEVLLGRTWHSDLRVYRDGDAWRGHLAFRSQGDGRSHRTADIFRERRLATVRGRFHEFDGATLEAFLRSILP